MFALSGETPLRIVPVFEPTPLPFYLRKDIRESVSCGWGQNFLRSKKEAEALRSYLVRSEEASCMGRLSVRKRFSVPNSRHTLP